MPQSQLCHSLGSHGLAQLPEGRQRVEWGVARVGVGWGGPSSRLRLLYTLALMTWGLPVELGLLLR